MTAGKMLSPMRWAGKVDSSNAMLKTHKNRPAEYFPSGGFVLFAAKHAII